MQEFSWEPFWELPTQAEAPLGWKGLLWPGTPAGSHSSGHGGPHLSAPAWLSPSFSYSIHLPVVFS